MAKNEDRDDVVEQFQDDVNMTASELRKWLDTDESKSVGDSKSGESTGHREGRKIVDLLGTKKDDLSDDDLDHMRKVSGYVARHLKQKPKDPEGSNWEYSLKNWGHDPSK